MYCCSRFSHAVSSFSSIDLPALQRPPARSRRRSRNAAMISPGNIIKQAVLVFSTFLALVPTLFMIMTALKSNEEYAIDKLGLPQAPVLDHFRDVLIDSPFIGWMKNSLILVLGAVILSAVISCIAAYAIASMEFRGRDWLLATSTALNSSAPSRRQPATRVTFQAVAE